MSKESIIVQRANVILHIAPEQLDYYMTQGYNVIDSAGNIIKASIPKDVGTLQKLYVEHTEKIAELEAEIKSLKQKRGRKQSKVEEE
ncbi:MAG: hypothetical protein IKN54_01100 [Lachnospiraceae bacterium]|nr:hypothetical protein [Lachnospiraceae bacterium]